MKKYFLFGDSHGEFDALTASLAAKGFDESNANHILFSVGDLFDRGNQNVKIYEYLQRFADLNRLHMVLGNHDQMLLDFLSMNFATFAFNIKHNGFFETVREFAKLGENDKQYQWRFKVWAIYSRIQNNFPRLHSFLKSMVSGGFLLDNYAITHGGFNLDIVEGKWYPECWGKTPFFVKHAQNFPTKFKFVFGHWHAWRLKQEFENTKEIHSDPFIYKNFIGLDAMTNISKIVNIFVVESDAEPQPFGSSISLDMLETF
jgi:hypothetical protein